MSLRIFDTGPFAFTSPAAVEDAQQRLEESGEGTVLLAGYFAGAVLGATILLYVVIGLVCCAAVYVLVVFIRRRLAARASAGVDGVVAAAVAGGQPRAENELDLVKDHERQHDQPDD